MSQQIIAQWTNPTTDTDGNAYLQEHHMGYVVSIDGGAHFAIPLTWGDSFDLGSLQAFQSLPTGEHRVTIQCMSRKGVVGRPSTSTFLVHPTPAAVGNFTVKTG